MGNRIYGLMINLDYVHTNSWTKYVGVIGSWVTKLNKFLCLTTSSTSPWNIHLLSYTFWSQSRCSHDDVIKWKHFPRNWPFVRGIHWSAVNSPHKGQWCRALMFSLICAWINGWVNNREAGDLKRHRAHYGVTVMRSSQSLTWLQVWILNAVELPE